MFSNSLQTFDTWYRLFRDCLGILLRISKSLLTTHKVFEKIRENSPKLLIVACGVSHKIFSRKNKVNIKRLLYSYHFINKYFGCFPQNQKSTNSRFESSWHWSQNGKNGPFWPNIHVCIVASNFPGVFGFAKSVIHLLRKVLCTKFCHRKDFNNKTKHDRSPNFPPRAHQDKVTRWFSKDWLPNGYQTQSYRVAHIVICP